MFILDAALANRGEDIAKGWAGSLTMGAGQFCTNPGVVVMPAGEATDRFAEIAQAALTEVPAQTMLTDGIAKAYRNGQARVAETAGVHEVLASTCDQRNATPFLYRTSAATWLANTSLAEEVFGPLGIIVTAETPDEMHDVARGLHGQLTCTLHMDEADMGMARSLLPILERKAGRVLANGFPTGSRYVTAWSMAAPTRLRPISVPHPWAHCRSDVSCVLSAIRIYRMHCCRNTSYREISRHPPIP